MALVASDRAQVRIEAGRVVTDLDRMKTAAAASDTATLATLVGDKPPDLLADLVGGAGAQSEGNDQDPAAHAGEMSRLVARCKMADQPRVIEGAVIGEGHGKTS